MGRGDFDPTPRSAGAQGPLRKAHGSAGSSQKAVKERGFSFKPCGEIAPRPNPLPGGERERTTTYLPPPED